MSARSHDHAAASLPQPRRLRLALPSLADKQLRLLSVVVFIVVWQVVAAPMNPILLPTPIAVAQGLFGLVRSGALLAGLLDSVVELAVGFGLAMTIGIGMGIVLGRYRKIEVLLEPYVNFMIATPLVAVIPLIIIWLGVAVEARIVVVVLIGVWPLLINTLAGIKNANRGYMELATSFGLSESQTLKWVSIPAAIPYIIAGTRVAMAKAIVGMIIAEMDMELAGLGGMVADFGDAFQTANLLAVIFCTSLFGVVSVVVMNLVVRSRFSWIQETAAAQR